MSNRPLIVKILRDGRVEVSRARADEKFGKGGSYRLYNIYDVTNRPFIREMIETITYHTRNYWVSMNKIGANQDEEEMIACMFIHKKVGGE